jgi:VIT1/CCC1 family predicted Fe2+/Mn2+ transporter
MAADAASAHLLIREALPASILSITGPGELEGMRQRLLALSGPARPLLDRHDVAAAARIFALVVLATFPVVIPFLLTDDLARALQASRAVALATLFVAGWALGRYAGHAHPVRTGMLMTVMGVALVAAVMALGG